MNYPDDNYDQVHGQILDAKREDYELWMNISHNQEDQHNKETAFNKAKRIEKSAHNIRP